VKFDTFIQKTKKLYSDARAPRNVQKLASDLAEVRAVVTRSVQEVLGAGEKLESVSASAAALRSESLKYSKKARQLSRQALMRQYLPFAVLAGVCVLLLLLRWMLRRGRSVLL
jgi:vesicle transport protein SEC22